MNKLQRFLQGKIIDCETIFEDASTTPDMIFLKGMAKHGGQTNALLMNIGKRQAYMEVLDYLRKEEIKDAEVY